jgi:integrase
MKARGTGSLLLRGQTWWVQYCHRGTVLRESSGSRNKSDATALLRQRLADIARGTPRARDAERLTFEQLAEGLLTDYRLNGRRSTARAAQAIARLREFFGRDVAAEVTPSRVASYIRARLDNEERPAKAATVRLEVSILRRAFSVALRDGRLPFKPAFPTVEVRNVRSGFFEEGQLRAVLERLPSHLHAVALFAYRTGWRKSEILTLRWGQVDLAAGIVRLEPGTTKNAEGRTFPFGADPVLRDLLHGLRSETSALERETASVVPFVFHRAGRPILDFYGAWRRACREAGVPGRIFHDFRRTAVRNMERAGVPRSVAMRLTGHKTESVYRRYAVTNEADLAEGVRKLASLTSPVVEPRRTAASEG